MDFKSADFESAVKAGNLRLEPMLPMHAELLFDALQSSELYRFIPQEPPQTVEGLRSRYQHWSKRFSSERNEIWLNYAIYDELRKTYVGTLQATIAPNERTYIAYETFPSYWRSGIASKACSALIIFIFKELGVAQIFALVDTRNIASEKLLRSLGFELIETIFGADEFKGIISDEYLFRLSVEAWEALHFNHG